MFTTNLRFSNKVNTYIFPVTESNIDIYSLSCSYYVNHIMLFEFVYSASLRKYETKCTRISYLTAARILTKQIIIN